MLYVKKQLPELYFMRHRHNDEKVNLKDPLKFICLR